MIEPECAQSSSAGAGTLPVNPAHPAPAPHSGVPVRGIEGQAHRESECVPIELSKKESRMKELIAAYEGCVKCALSMGRKTIVSGTGDLNARLMIIGEAPGADEDEQGLPFVGRSGQLLTKMLAAIGLDRKNVFITNIVKCRPPQNRNPEKVEIESCHPFLVGQIDIIAPELIVTLGSFAARTILALDDKVKISKFRGQIFLYRDIKCLPTFHPAYLLRNQSAKKEAMVDLKKIKEILG